MARATFYMSSPTGSVAGGNGGDPLAAVTAIGEVEGVSAVEGAPEAVTAAEALLGAGIVVSYDQSVITDWNALATALRAIINHAAVNFPPAQE